MVGALRAPHVGGAGVPGQATALRTPLNATQPQNTNRPESCHRIARYAHFLPCWGAHIVRFCGRELRKVRITRVFMAEQACIHVFGQPPHRRFRQALSRRSGERSKAAAQVEGIRSSVNLPGAARPPSPQRRVKRLPRCRLSGLPTESTYQVPPGARPAQRRRAP